MEAVTWRDCIRLPRPGYPSLALVALEKPLAADLSFVSGLGTAERDDGREDRLLFLLGEAEPGAQRQWPFCPWAASGHRGAQATPSPLSASTVPSLRRGHR